MFEVGPKLSKLWQNVLLCKNLSRESIGIEYCKNGAKCTALLHAIQCLKSKALQYL